MFKQTIGSLLGETTRKYSRNRNSATSNIAVQEEFYILDAAQSTLFAANFPKTKFGLAWPRIEIVFRKCIS